MADWAEKAARQSAIRTEGIGFILLLGDAATLLRAERRRTVRIIEVAKRQYQYPGHGIINYASGWHEGLNSLLAKLTDGREGER